MSNVKANPSIHLRAGGRSRLAAKGSPIDDVALIVRELLNDPDFADALTNLIRERLDGRPHQHRPFGETDALVPLDVVTAFTGLKKTKIYAMIRAGEFPAPYKPGGAASRWSMNELLDWRRSRKPAR